MSKSKLCFSTIGLVMGLAWHPSVIYAQTDEATQPKSSKSSQPEATQQEFSSPRNRNLMLRSPNPLNLLNRNPLTLPKPKEHSPTRHSPRNQKPVLRSPKLRSPKLHSQGNQKPVLPSPKLRSLKPLSLRNPVRGSPNRRTTTNSACCPV